jgi:hypothetical protein
VIATTNAVGLDEAEVQRRVAVRALFADARERTVIFAQHEQFFAHDLDALLARFSRQLFRRAHGLPVPAQQFAARCSRTDLREPLVLLRGQHQL